MPILDQPLFDRVALIGIGLIGSSLSHAIRRNKIANHVVVSTRTQATLDEARNLSLGDSYVLDPAEAVRDCDLVIVSVPVGASGAVARAVAPGLKPGAIVTDVGSTKASVIRQMTAELPDTVHFIAGHPIAGTEYSGPASGFATLFEGRWCILTPQPGTDKAALHKLKAFWEACGSNLDIMDPDHHDRVLAVVSHLPQLISYNIVDTVIGLEDEEVGRGEIIKYSASGFRDFTRLAASDPIMWRDVCLHNKQAILEMLARFSEDLSALRASIRKGDADALEAMFTRTRAIRTSIVEAGQDVDVPNFGRQPLDE